MTSSNSPLSHQSNTRPTGRIRYTPLALFVILTMTLGLLAACGGDEPGTEENQDENQNENEVDPEPPTNNTFTFTEEEPGAHVGAYATVEIDGEEFESNLTEILLESSESIDDASVIDDDVVDEATSQIVAPEPHVTDAAFLSGELAPDSEPPLRAKYEHLIDEPTIIRDRFEADKQAIDDVPKIDPSVMQQNSDRRDGCDSGPVLGVQNVGVEIGTFNGWTCSTSLGGSVEQLGFTESYDWIVIYAPEGVYFTMAEGAGISVPVVGVGASGSVATTHSCSFTGRDYVDYDYLDSLTSWSIGGGVSISTPSTHPTGPSADFSLDWGFGSVIDPTKVDDYVAQGVVGWEVSSGFSLSAQIGGLNVPPPFDIITELSVDIDFSDLVSGPDELDDKEGMVLHPIPVSGWRQRCMDNHHQDPDEASVNPNEGLDELVNNISSSSWMTRTTDDGAVVHDLGANTALSGLTGSFFEWMNSPAGIGTADNIPAGTHADWYREWFESETTAGCEDCSNTSINFLAEQPVEQLADVLNDPDEDNSAGGFLVGLVNGMRYMRSAPEMDTFNTMAEGFEATVNATYYNVLAEQAATGDDPNRYVNTTTLEYAVRAGETAEMPVTAAELAELVDATEDDVQGTEVCLSTFFATSDEEICGTLDGEQLVYNYNASDPEPQLFNISVDLGEADGFDAEDVEDWMVVPARRLVTPIVDEPATARLTVAPSAISGAPVTLQAKLTDDNGRFVEQPATFRFYDAEGELLAEVDSDNGRANHQFIPEPVAPEIDVVEESPITYGDDTEGIGYGVHGERFSRDADVVVDGEVLSDDDLIIQYEHPGLIVLAPRENVEEPMFDDGQTFEVVNPGELGDTHTAAF